MRTGWALVLTAVVACSPAREGDEADAAGAADLAAAPDLAHSPAPDLVQPPAADLLPAAKDEVISVGTFSRGKVSLVRTAAGAKELRLSADFAVELGACLSNPPDSNTLVLLTWRPEIPAMDPHLDVSAGSLKAIRGAQVYSLAGLSLPDFMSDWYVHVFCKSPAPLKQFSLAVARMGLP